MGMLDQSLFLALRELVGRSPAGDVAIIFLAEYLPYAAGIGVLAAILLRFRTRWLRMAIFVFGTSIFSRFILTEAVRVFVDRERPFVMEGFVPLVSHDASPSFPSGHAAFFFGYAFALWPYHRTASIVMLVVSALMGLARVAIGVHWPSDIIAGAVIGFVTTLCIRWGISLVRKLKTAH